MTHLIKQNRFCRLRTYLHNLFYYLIVFVNKHYPDVNNFESARSVEGNSITCVTAISVEIDPVGRRWMIGICERFVECTFALLHRGSVLIVLD